MELLGLLMFGFSKILSRMQFFRSQTVKYVFLVLCLFVILLPCRLLTTVSKGSWILVVGIYCES